MRTKAEIRSSRVTSSLLAAACAFLILPLTSGAFSVPGSSESAAEVAESKPSSDSDPLEQLVAPVALYPDDLLAIVLPASTYPIQIVQASRFLADRKSNPDLEPNPEWDESVYALLNYPEALALLDEDLDWTWQLGEAVVEDQGAVMDAVQRFRQRVHAAGNLESNDKQVVAQEDRAIIIETADPEVIYVPTYSPSQVVIVQPRWPIYWWSDPYPYYYSPVAPFWTGFGSGFVWGLAWGGWRYPHHYYAHHHITVHEYGHVHKNRRGRHPSDHGDAWKPREGKMQGGRPGRASRLGKNKAHSRSTNLASAPARTSRSSTSGQAHGSRFRPASQRDSGGSRISPKSGGKSASASAASSRASRVTRTGGSRSPTSRSRGNSARSRIAESRGKNGSSSARRLRLSKSRSSGSSRALVRSSGPSANKRARSLSTASPARRSRAISSPGSSRRAAQSRGISRVRSSSGFKASSGRGARRGGGARGGGGRRGGWRG
jgi:hypothetical protein